MEEKKYGGYENHEERRDYARNEESRNSYSSEGRKLRPRRKVAPSSDNERRGGYPFRQSRNNSYGERQNNREDRPSYSQHRSYDEGRPSYGQSRPRYGQNRQDGYNQDRQGGYGQNRRGGYNQDRQGGYGQNRRGNYSQDRPAYGEGRSNFGEERPSYGQRRSYGEGRPSFGHQHKGYGNGNSRPAPKKPVHKSGSHFTATDEAGINQMISRKPQVDNHMFSDNDNVATPIKEEIRLNKFIANSGVCSRREADTLIQAGVVTVNGEVVTELGTKINVLKDDVRFNGERLKGEEKVYIVMNKPKGFVTSASDPHAEKTVMDLLKGCTIRVFPVGRLDKNTTGVLMFTNDGEIAEQLTHPSFNKKKIYQVILDKALDEEDKEKILVEGLNLSDGTIKADELEYIDAEDHRRLGIEIHSGKNRIVRRIFESLGYTVKALDRVYFAGLTKKGLKKGEWRYLSEGEVNVLKMGAYV